MNTTIYFQCPEYDQPCGGVRVLYRHVDILNAAGHPAAIVHARRGFRDTWFSNNTRVVHTPLAVSRDDILVLPELQASDVATLAPGVRKVIYNQTPYFMFRGANLDPADRRSPYLHRDVVAAFVVSEDSLQYMQHVFPRLPTYRVVNAVDERFVPPAGPKRRQIAYMPRKHSEDSEQVISILKFRGALHGWEVVPIHKVDESTLVRIMRESLVFLSFGYPEGFGLPPAEAMAAGCVVIGYHGNGAREYMTTDRCFPIEAGDILGFAMAAEFVLANLSVLPSHYVEMTRRASAFIRQTYSQIEERRSVVSAWEAVLTEKGLADSKP